MRLREYKSTTKKSRADLARELGPQPGTETLWSESTIGVYLSGSYPAESAANLNAAVMRLLARVDERRRVIVQPVFARTSIAKTIHTLIKRCSLFVKIGVVGAEPGVGKTEAVNRWALDNPTSILIRANRTFMPGSSMGRGSSHWPTMLQLAKVLEVPNAANLRAQTYLYDSIVERLRGSGRVVIIDQAHFVPGEAIEILTTLNEDANIPVILTGHTSVIDRGPRDLESLTAFRRRSLRVKITAADIKGADVDLIAEQILGEEVARDAAKRLLQEARRAGALGWVVSLLQYAQTISEGPVTLAEVLQAIEEVPPVMVGGAA
jgi:DNA transposition AAA+ family ATPase